MTMTPSPPDHSNEPLLLTSPAGRRRFSEGLLAAVGCAVIAGMVLEVLATALEAATIAAAGRHAAKGRRPITAVVTILGTVAAFLIAFWRACHGRGSDEPPAGPPEAKT